MNRKDFCSSKLKNSINICVQRFFALYPKISLLLSFDRYQFEQMFLHWGSKNDNGGGAKALGSEHAINGHFFPAEIQLYGFNADLFHNLSEGMMQPYGAVGVVIMVQESDRGSS